jgi:hypothetical protein
MSNRLSNYRREDYGSERTAVHRNIKGSPRGLYPIDMLAGFAPEDF